MTATAGRVLEVPGIHRGLSFEAYNAIDAVNQSTLKAMSKSPLHYRHRLENELEETGPMRLGAIAHCACLEYDRLASRYAAYQPPEGASERFAGKAFEAFVEAEAALGRKVVKQREIEAALRIRAALHSNRLVGRYLARGEAEVVLLWRDEPTGILCKARLDWISLSVPDVIVELKTARDVGPWAFSTAFARAGYDVQAAFYADGYRACTGRAPGGKVIAIESAEPHDSIVYDLNEVIDAGREIYRGYMERLAECRRSGDWPGQAPSAEQILRLPKWRDPFDDDNADPFADLGLEV